MASTSIHPGAYVAATACLGEGVEIGFGAVIEDGVSLGDGCVVEHHAVIRRGVSMGSNNYVASHAVLGTRPQHLEFDPRTPTSLVIGDQNVFREGSNVSLATSEDIPTRIGSRCYLMTTSHVAHDCHLDDGVILATGVTLGGHVEVGPRAFIGGGSMAHQWCRIGAYAMVAGLLAIRRDVLPYTLLAGEPPLHYRTNLLGLRRAGIDGARLGSVVEAVRRLRSGEALEDLPDTPELRYLQAWLAADSRRGLYRFVGPRTKTQG
ncbi:Acyl-[acyl-carrier-protein]--UDP-N-acetylglucosamine O-acyltransferase [Enhygromyxa salina]|uniref:Acyl-[acyl-carrier-protein]--UDP-N-acetylglucosamine O-acyltransferase n=1 Tax=Enhygromyxa salina TaxID=215803 RepID=A0A0C2DGA6_9BACT|nr:acyl-ACP--UDP-N-acetylglucosamine O-acyltransferase [Enhygromyxa salina]KIG18702.1 Acyl-[acyl-carrier-protein]--UDP-N-acetylglucosamine O-acyltransferase [Enhygromyxa salina]